MPDPIGYAYDPLPPGVKKPAQPVGYAYDPLPPVTRSPSPLPSQPSSPYPTAAPTAPAIPPPPAAAAPVGDTSPGARTPTAAPTGAPATPAVSAPTDPNAAMGQVQAAFQSKFNRAMTPEEQQALIQYVGYTGGAVTSDMLQKALGAVGQYTGNLQNPGLGAPGAATTPGATPPPTAKSLEEEQRRQLMELLKGNTPVTTDPNNPAVAAERNFFNRANSQATQKQRLAAAERGAARGTLGAGGFDAELAGIENNQATRASGFESELMKNERQGQIDRLMAALGLTQQYGATQLQGQLGKGQLSLGYLQALLGDKQANNALGYNYTALQQAANNQAMQTILSQL